MKEHSPSLSQDTRQFLDATTSLSSAIACMDAVAWKLMSVCFVQEGNTFCYSNSLTFPLSLRYSLCHSNTQWSEFLFQKLIFVTFPKKKSFKTIPNDKMQVN